MQNREELSKQEYDSHSDTDKTTDIDDRDKNIFDYLNEEIAYIRNEQLKPGWTVWAIIATIASLIWLFFSELEKQPGHFETVIFLYLIIEYLIASILYWYGLFDVSKDSSENTKFRPLYFLYINGLLLIVTIVRNAAMIVTTFLLQHKINPLVSITSYTYNTIEIGILLMALLAFQDLERKRVYADMRFRRHKGKFRFIWLALGVTSVFLFYAYVRYALDIHLFINVSDIRFVSLIFAVIYLFSLLSRIQTKSPVLELLVGIRRDYMLGKLDKPTARKRVDNALSGLQVSDVQDEQTQILMSDLEGAEKEIDRAMEEINTLERYYQKVGDKLSRNQLANTQKANQAIYDHFMGFSVIMRDHVRVMIIRMMDMIDSYKDAAVPKLGFIPFLDGISFRVNEINKKYVSAKELWLSLLVSYEAREITERWKRKISALKLIRVSFSIEDDV